jgi:dihydroflavonol-4-reductase
MALFQILLRLGMGAPCLKIAVTGATGHVGINLVERLVADGHEVRAFAAAGLESLQHLPVDLRVGDVRDEEALADFFAGVDLVFHLAAVISIDGDRGGMVTDVNVGGALAAANAALRAGVKRFVHFCSIHAFDMYRIEGVVDETSPRALGAQSAAYDRSKAQGEAAVREAIERGLDAVIIHPTGIIGPADPGPSKAGKGLLDAARGRLPFIVNGGFDWVDVRDVIAGALAAAERGTRGHSYILSGFHRSLEELVAHTARCAGVAGPMVTLPYGLVRSVAVLPTLIGRLRGREPLFTTESLATLAVGTRFSHERATRELGYRPRPSEETIADLVDWFDATGRISRAEVARPVADAETLQPAFVRQLLAHPVDSPAERRILARVLATVAASDGATHPSEEAMLAEFSADDAEELLEARDLTPEELEGVDADTRESILLAGMVLACVDEEYATFERDAIERLRRQLTIAPERSELLEGWAKAFVVDQRFDEFYADGIIDPEERKRIEQIAAGLMIAPAALAEIDARARQRWAM